MLMLVIAAVNGVVGFIQFNLTPEQLSAWGPGYATRLSGQGDVAARTFVDDQGDQRNRPFALGSDFGFGGVVGMLAAPGALALLALARRRALKVATIALSIGLIVGVVTSQARTAVLGTVVALAAYAMLGARSRSLGKTLPTLAVAGVIGYFVVSALTSGDSGAYRYESITPGNAVSTTVDYRKDTLRKIPEYAVKIPLGGGIGSKGPGGSVGGRSESGGALDGESEPTFLIIELGVAGLVVLFGLFLKLFSLSLRRIKRLGDPELRVLLAGVAAPLFAMFVTGIVGVYSATNPTSPYIWFTAGVLAYWLFPRGAPVPEHRFAAPVRDRRPELERA
jgi:hypothetical protein